MNLSVDQTRQAPGHSAAVLQRWKQFYEQFAAEDIGQLDVIYTPDVEFRDPVNVLQGTLALKRHLRRMAARLGHCRIRYLDQYVHENSAYLTWEMEYAHPRRQGGAPRSIRGITHLKFTSKVFYQEDSYDPGVLLYGHMPVLGGVMRYLKRRMTR